MARQAIWYGQLTDEVLNGSTPYRVRLSYGVFSIAPKVTQSGIYHYSLKRHKGRLYKHYVGKAGEIDAERLHQATMQLLHKIYVASGDYDLVDHRGREPQ